MAEDARVQLAINGQRLREIIENRDKQQTTQQHPRMLSDPPSVDYHCRS